MDIQLTIQALCKESPNPFLVCQTCIYLKSKKCVKSKSGAFIVFSSCWKWPYSVATCGSTISMTLSFWVILSCVFHVKERWHPISSGLCLPNAINSWPHPWAFDMWGPCIPGSLCEIPTCQWIGLREILRETPNGPPCFHVIFSTVSCRFSLKQTR